MYGEDVPASVYRPEVAVALGICRIVCGAVAIALQVPTTLLSVGTSTVDIVYSYPAAGVWCGVMFATAGSFGLGSAYRRTYCHITTNMVISTISVVLFCPSLLILSILAIVEAWHIRDNLGWSATQGLIPVIAMYGVLTVIAVFEAIFDIVAAGLSCGAICCCQSHTISPGLGHHHQHHKNAYQRSSITTQTGSRKDHDDERWEDRSKIG